MESKTLKLTYSNTVFILPASEISMFKQPSAKLGFFKLVYCVKFRYVLSSSILYENFITRSVIVH